MFNYIRIFLLHRIAVQDTVHHLNGFCTSCQSLYWNKNWPFQIVSFCYNTVFLSAVTVQSLLSMHDWSNQARSGEVDRTHQTCLVPSFKSQSSLCSYYFSMPWLGLCLEVISYCGLKDFGTKQRLYTECRGHLQQRQKVANYRLALYLEASLGSLLGLLQSSASGVVL